MGSNTEEHSDDAVAHQADVPLPPLLPLLCRHFLSLTELLPVTNIFVGRRTGGEVDQEIV